MLAREHFLIENKDNMLLTQFSTSFAIRRVVMCQQILAVTK